MVAISLNFYPFFFLREPKNKNKNNNKNNNKKKNKKNKNSRKNYWVKWKEGEIPYAWKEKVPNTGRCEYDEGQSWKLEVLQRPC